MDEAPGTLHLANRAVQQMHKSLRSLRNKGHATDQDVADAAQAVKLVRGIFARHGWQPEDVDHGNR